MDNLNLSAGESLLFRTQRVVISGVIHEAVLTNKRLILVISDTGTIEREIPLADIREAETGMNNLREPTISLRIQSPGQEVQETELIFLYQISGLHIQERDRFIAAIKNLGISAKTEGAVSGTSPPLQSAATKPGELEVEEQPPAPARLQAPDLMISSIPRASRNAPDEDQKPRSTLSTVLTLIAIFGIVIVAIFISGQFINDKKPSAQQSLQAIQPTVVATVPPTPVPVTTPEVTPAEPGAPIPGSEFIIPPTGIWVQVQYPGIFSGSIVARGRTISVNGSGTKFYQLSLADPAFEGSISKTDGSGEKLVVNTYQDGKLIGRRSTVSPFGQVDLHMSGPETVTEDAPTPVPTPVPEVVYEYLPAITVPVTGTWVRVYYSGEYDGYAGGRGIMTPITGTGDQIFKMPDYITIVEGSIEKLDGSNGWMVVEVYNNGTRITQMETRKPYGLIDLHESI